VETPTVHGPATLDALDELIRAASSLEPAVARRAGLSTSELQALRYLVDGSRGPVELSHLLGVTSAASSGVVDRLAARGHVRRRPHPADGRRTQVEITGSGRQALDSLLEPMQARLADVDESLGEDERAAVGRYLTRVTEVLRSTL
jgi:DNA-binding MarR family transcriptional regulator